MVIVKIIGGLGNQMFQYALGRSLAEKDNAEFKMDISSFTSYKLRSYALDAFNIKKNIASTEEIERFKKYKPKRGRKMFLFNFFYNILHADSSKYVEEKGLGFDPEIMDLPDDVYLDGYWQSEKYFKNIEPLIRADFSFILPQGERDTEISALMRESTAISIHIRRTDYVTNAATNKVHGTCGIDYYEAAIKLIAEKIANPHFFVFSDDHAWVKGNITTTHPMTYVEHNDASTDYQDLRLMSECKHNIIANSSFSWWGAWLNPNPDKIVIAPKKWFADTTIDTNDMIPSVWTRL